MNWVQSLLTLLVASGMGIFYALMDFSKKSPRHIRVNEREFRMPDTRFHYSAAQLYQSFAEVGEENHPRLRRFWLLDFGFIVCFLGVMLAIDLNFDKPATTLYVVMGSLAVARAALDVLENVLLLRALRLYPARRNAMAGLAGFVTSAKFICLYGWVLLLFYKLFSQAFGFVPYSGL